jgi:hypothetical protein
VEQSDIARAVAAGRVLIGTALTLAPGPAAAGWIGRDSSRPGSQAMIRGLGARDLGLGLGVLYAASSGSSLRPWLAASALADAADFAATVIHGDKFPSTGRIGALAIAGGSAIICAVGATLAED